MKKTLSLVLVFVLIMTTCGAFAEGIAIKDEHSTLKVLMNSVSYDPNDIIETKVVEEVTGYHVEYSTLPSDAAQRDTAALMAVANQDDYDLVLDQEDPLKKEVATQSNILAWEIPWTEDPGGLQSMGSPRVRHD